MCRIFVVSNAYKKKKNGVFEGCPVGLGGVPTGAGLVDGGVDQGPWLQEGWGLVGCSKEGQVQGRVGLLGSSTGGGKGSGGNPRASVPEG